ncbi:alpha-1,6-mannosyl-glycoprotein 2-beta-N-acetylglucosaminyltransferase-like [Amphiura filiformis]|uniref:alpha-1,6-mannosyl-glycoprotein 2-beta-N-acetylglucosaminyltransferase-like n=1 Tax=Amphiura filiformis TaxID=82378 RepID=UPI003B21CE7B
MRLRRTLYKLTILVGLGLMYTIYKVSLRHSTDADYVDSLRNVAGRDIGKSGNRELHNLHNPANPIPPEQVKVFGRDKEASNNSDHAVKFVHRTSKPVVADILPKNITFTGKNSVIKRAMLEVNHRQEIFNSERFPQRSESSVVIVVMVHKRLEYLRFLIDSLRKARDIDDALLIFSHDFYSEEINALVRSIDFCQTMQIFYPYSLQIYENEFPGQDPNDCPRDIKRDRAKVMKCNNWEHPDKYGHYREVSFVMTKHHWFWKFQNVFTGLEATKDHQGLVLFIEEDHYVTPDFYVMVKNMYELKKRQTSQTVDILTLGTYDKNRNFRDRSDKADVLVWHSSKHNMGMALDRKTWERIQTCVQEFCSYDDYNWDWTLQHISNTCLKPPLHVMVLKAPRIFHIGECGIHHKGKGKCDADNLVSQIDSLVKTSTQYLFPENLELSPKTRPIRSKDPKPNGGWGDVRDHALCMTYGKPTDGKL